MVPKRTSYSFSVSGTLVAGENIEPFEATRKDKTDLFCIALSPLRPCATKMAWSLHIFHTLEYHSSKGGRRGASTEHPGVAAAKETAEAATRAKSESWPT